MRSKKFKMDDSSFVLIHSFMCCFFILAIKLYLKLFCIEINLQSIKDDISHKKVSYLMPVKAQVYNFTNVYTYLKCFQNTFAPNRGFECYYLMLHCKFYSKEF